MENTPDIDDFHVKTQHVNKLFNLIKDRNDNEFIEYISKLNPDEVDVNIKDVNGNYLVFFAVIMNNSEILKILIKHETRLDILDTDGHSILYYPIRFNYQNIIDILLESDKNIIGMSLVNLRDSQGSVPLFYAIKYKNHRALDKLLINDADANYKNGQNMNSLHLAVLKKDVIMVKMIAKYIKNINARSLAGSTALHYACSFQSIDIVDFLISIKANQNIIEIEYDFYPIFYAVVQNNIAITKTLVNANADPNHQDYIGNTFIHYAIINAQFEILDHIFHKYDVRNKKPNVYTENINDKSTNIDHCIDPNIVNIDGLTITHLLLYDHQEAFDKYLVKILPHANLNYQDNKGATILHILAENDIWKKFEDILETRKLNIYIKNNSGKTVFDMIKLTDREYFLNVIVKSYYTYLRKYPNDWALSWQNNCSEDDKQNCYKYIRETIIKDKTSVPIRKNKINITVVENELVYFSTFTGSLLDMICGFKYLIEKYPYATTLFHGNQGNSPEFDKYLQSLGIQENYNQHIIQFEIRWIYQRIFFPPGFETIMSNILTSKKYRYIIIPIGIILSNGNHSNGLFYDIENHIMERFEPHGSNYPIQFNYNPDLLDDILYKTITNIISNINKKYTTIKYYQPKNYLPKIGFQTLENNEINVNKNIGDPNGFCTLWTIWYLDYRLKYADIKPKRIVSELIQQINQNNYSFRTIIRNYSKHITDLRDSYLDKIRRNINDYLNNRLSSGELRKLLIEILSDID
jgi:ankyrin repeat protein